MEWNRGKKFLCPGLEDYSLGVGEQYYKKEAFEKGAVMQLASEMNKEHKKSVFLKIPLDYNMEYMAFGGKVKWNGERYISEGYRFQEIDEIGALLDVSYKMECFSLVFECLAHCPYGEEVLLGVEGPFSVLATLIDPIILLKNLRKKKTLIQKVLYHIADILFLYIKDSIERGVIVISYADPIGTLEFLGKNNYAQYNGKVTAYLMRKLEPYLKTACVHFCGKCSVALELTGFIRSHRLDVEERYGQAVLYYSQKKEVTFLGHGCINCERQRVKKIWKLEFLSVVGQEIQVKPMTQSHQTEVLRIYGESIQTEDVTLVTSTPTWEEWSQSHEKECRYVAYIYGKAAGFIALSKTYTNPVYHGIAEVSIYVDFRYRKRGVAFRLMQELIRGSEKEGYYILRSRIFPGNQASIALHKKAGFRMTNYHEKAAKKNGVWRDVCEFERRSPML